MPRSGKSAIENEAQTTARFLFNYELTITNYSNSGVSVSE